MSEPLVKIKQLSVQYSKNVNILSNVNLSLEEGEIVVVIGENGSGKSTLLKTICGLLPYAVGNVELIGTEVKVWNKEELSKTLAYVSSGEQVNSMLTAYEFVGFGRYPYSNWLAKLSEEDEIQIQEAMASCGITYLKEKSMGELSDGEHQKVHLARAIAQQTPLVVLDEPTTHLDIKSTHAIFQLLKGLKQKKKSILFSSHQVEKALKIADKIWLVDCGRVVTTTPTAFWKDKNLQSLIFGKEG